MSIRAARRARSIGACLFLLVPAGLAAQAPARAEAQPPGPVAATGAVFVAPVSPLSDTLRLPVLDDAGEPIPFDEIHARVRPASGGKVVVGGVLGVVLGLAAGAAVAEVVSCGQEMQQTLCSPQETSLREAITGIGAGLGLGVGVASGWRSSAVSWQEAVEQIREERRNAAGRQP